MYAFNPVMSLKISDPGGPQGFSKWQTIAMYHGKLQVQCKSKLATVNYAFFFGGTIINS